MAKKMRRIIFTIRENLFLLLTILQAITLITITILELEMRPSMHNSYSLLVT
jgi:hypothetical protein